MSRRRRRASVGELVGSRVLVKRLPDAGECRQLLSDAEKHVQTAGYASKIDDCAGILLLAYEASRKSCLALVRVMGFEPEGQGRHETTFEAADALFGGHEGGQDIEAASFMREDRHGNMYRAEHVDCDHARENLDIAKRLVALAGPAVEKVIAEVEPFD